MKIDDSKFIGAFISVIVLVYAGLFILSFFVIYSMIILFRTSGGDGDIKGIYNRNYSWCSSRFSIKDNIYSMANEER